MITTLHRMPFFRALLYLPLGADAATCYPCTDVHATLGGTGYSPTDNLLSSNGSYSLVLDLGDPI